MCVRAVLQGLFNAAVHADSKICLSMSGPVEEGEVLLGWRQNKDQLTVRKCTEQQTGSCLGFAVRAELTYRQKLIEADLVILVAIEFLHDLPKHVSRYVVAGTFEEVMEFQVADVSVSIQIYGHINITFKHQGTWLKTEKKQQFGVLIKTESLN